MPYLKVAYRTFPGLPVPQTGPRAPGRAKGPNGEETNEVYEETTGGVACEPDGSAAAPCAGRRR